MMAAGGERESVFFRDVGLKSLPVLQEMVLHPFTDRQH